MKKILTVIILSLFLCATIHADEESEEQKDRLIDIFKKPFEIILAPIEGGGLVDLIFEPAEAVLSPISALGDIVVTPGRTQEYVFNVNKNISIITAEDIAEVEPEYIQQMLDRETGIVVNGFLGNVKDNNIDMRGFGETGLLNCVVLIDGRRTNQIDISGADMAQIDINSIEKIEVIRGASCVLYGDNATGGVINIITKKGEAPAHVEYIQEFGSYQRHKEYVSMNGGHDFLDYFCSYSYQDSDGYRVNNAYEADDLFASMTVKPDDFLDVHFSSSYHRDWYGMPGALYPGNIQSDGREGSRFPDSKAKTEDYYFMVVPRILGESDGHETVLSSLISCRDRRTNSRSVGWNVYEANHHISSFEFKPKCEVNSTFFEETLENKLVFGMDYFYARDQVLSGDIAFTKSQVDIIKETFGIYASDSMMVARRFIFSGGVRGEWAGYIFDQFQPANTYGTQCLKEAAFDAGVGYKYNERSQVYANFARSYRFPTTDEFFQSAYETLDWATWAVRVFPAVLNSDLKQQVGNNCEVGIKDNSFKFLKVNLTYYLIDNKNEIYYDPILFQNTNYPNTMHYGLELETRVDVRENINVFFNYTFQKSFFVGGKFASETIPLVPKTKITTGFNIKPIKPLNVNFALNYISARYVTSDQMNNVSKLKPHVTLDLSIFYELPNIRFFGTIKNFLGESYYSSAIKNWLGDVAFYPAPETTFEGGVTIDF